MSEPNERCEKCEELTLDPRSYPWQSKTCDRCMDRMEAEMQSEELARLEAEFLSGKL